MIDEAVLNAISLVGFPIVMCLALFWYMIQQDTRFENIVSNLTESLHELKITLEGLKNERH